MPDSSNYAAFLIIRNCKLSCAGFLHVENGLINRSLIPALGLEGVDWYSNPKYWPWILVIVNFWKTTGYGSVVYLAGIAGIDTSLYEAAKVDGASRWQQIRYITLPGHLFLLW